MEQTLHADAEVDVVHADAHVHVTPVWLLAVVLGVLLVLTWLTVSVTHFQLGELNIWIALLIAGVKAIVVALYFMHLRWDSRFNALVFACAVVFLVLFIGVTLMDSAEYQRFVNPLGNAQAIPKMP